MNNEFQKFLDCIGGLGVTCLMTDRVFGFNIREKILNTTTFKAWRFVEEKDPAWIQRLTKRLKSEKRDLKNIEAMFGELRAYADILTFPFYEVSSNSGGKGADFTLTDKSSKEKVKVEVYTQQVKDNCVVTEDVNVHNFKESLVTPLMDWKTTLKNVSAENVSIAKGTIRNVGGSKKDAHQVDANIPTYLYIDFQSIWGLGVDQAHPVMAQAERFTSGVFWLAFYGKKGMPILENLNLEEPTGSQKMDTDGIFFNAKSSKWAGALLRVAGSGSGNPLVFFENPKSKVTPSKFIAAMMLSGLYNAEMSCDSFAGVNVQSKVRQCNKRISNLYKAYRKIEATLRGLMV